MRFEQFKKEVDANVRGRIRPEDIIRYNDEWGGETLISVIPAEYSDRMYPSISLTELFEVFKNSDYSIDDIGAHIIQTMLSLWEYAIENGVVCPCCGEEEHKKGELLC